MAAVEVTITGVLYDKLARTSRPVVLIGDATLTGLGVGGGPVYPPEGGGGGGGGEHPEHPIYYPPTIWPDPRPPGGGGGSPPSIWPGRPTHPIVLPPDQVPPDQQPPQTPPPGTVTPVPPPAGSSGWPTTGIVPPPYVVLQYPGVGPVYVTPPAQTAPSPS